MPRLVVTLIPFSLYMSEAGNLSKFSHSTTMCPWGKCCYIKALCNIGCQAIKDEHHTKTEIFFLPYYAWESAEAPVAAACFRHCNNGVVQTMVYDQAECTPDLYGNRNRYGLPIMHHIWNIAVKSCTAQVSDLGKGTQTLRLWGFLYFIIRETAGQRPGTKALCISLDYPQIRA